MKKITNQQFRAFSNEASAWLSWFGLSNWRTDISHQQIDDDECLACCMSELGQRRANLALNISVDQDTPVTFPQVKKAGFHEVVELLMARIRKLGEKRMDSGEEDEFDDAIHEVIRVLENTLFDRKPYPKVGK